MRAALQALRQRREDLNQAEAEIETLRGQLQTAQKDIQALQEGKATSATVVLQTQLSSAKVELQAAREARLAQQAEVEKAQAELAEARASKAAALQESTAVRAELAVARREGEEQAAGRKKVAAEAEALKSQFAASQVEARQAAEEAQALRTKLQTDLQEALKAKLAQAVEKEAATSALATARAEVEELKKTQVNLSKQLGATQASMTEAIQNRASLQHELEVVRAQAKEDLQHLREQLDGGEGAMHASACAELEAAWSALVGIGLEQMRRALSTAGVRESALRQTFSQASSSGGTGRRQRLLGGDLEQLHAESAALARGSRLPASPPASGSGSQALKRRRSSAALEGQDTEERGEPSKRKEKAERKDKKDKKERKREKKDRKDKKVESDDSEEDQDIGSAPRASAPKGATKKSVVNLVRTTSGGDDDTDTASQESDARGRALFAHRVYAPGRSSLKKRRTESRVGKPAAKPRVKFAGEDGRGGKFVSEVPVVSYRHMNEQLWFNNPQANVLCELCKRRVPQKLGMLRGGSGGSSFMCDDFICGTCAEGSG